MSEFTVCYADNGYCLALDDTRIAGGKPAAMEDNVIASWITKEKYVKERTCHKKHREDGYDFCSECGWNITCSNDRYCPNCGARIEQGQGRLDI